jgi:hypothetical protein
MILKLGGYVLDFDGFVLDGQGGNFFYFFRSKKTCGGGELLFWTLGWLSSLEDDEEPLLLLLLHEDGTRTGARLAVGVRRVWVWRCCSFLLSKD